MHDAVPISQFLLCAHFPHRKCIVISDKNIIYIINCKKVETKGKLKRNYSMIVRPRRHKPTLRVLLIQTIEELFLWAVDGKEEDNDGSLPLFMVGRVKDEPSYLFIIPQSLVSINFSTSRHVLISQN